MGNDRVVPPHQRLGSSEERSEHDQFYMEGRFEAEGKHQET